MGTGAVFLYLVVERQGEVNAEISQIVSHRCTLTESRAPRRGSHDMRLYPAHLPIAHCALCSGAKFESW
jgi:hypothetical protein